MPAVSHPATASVIARPLRQSNRRAFLQDCARGAILAGLAVLGVALGSRKGDPAAVEPCLKQRVCRGCGLYDRCALPQAEATRKLSS